MPGSGIPVVDTARLDTRETDYCFLFAWNYRDDILRATREFREGGGRYLVPFPALTVL